MVTISPETAAEFLRSRANWLRVETVTRSDGGWDVVLRIDGTYSLDGQAEMVQFFQRWLLEVFRTEGISPHQLHAWAQEVRP